MESSRAVCERCGGPIYIGDWPFCSGDPRAHVPAPNFGEEPLESYIDQHVDVVPRAITTRAERRRIMNKNHLEYVPKAKRLGAVTYVDLGRRG